MNDSLVCTTILCFSEIASNTFSCWKEKRDDHDQGRSHTHLHECLPGASAHLWLQKLPLLFLGGVSCIINCHTLFIEMYCNVCETPLFHSFLRWRWSVNLMSHIMTDDVIRAYYNHSHARTKEATILMQATGLRVGGTKIDPPHTWNKESKSTIFLKRNPFIPFLFNGWCFEL